MEIKTTKEEFNLSNKIKEINVIGEYLIPKYIKEFIKLLKDGFIEDEKDGTLCEEYLKELFERIDKLSGEKLK